MKEKNRSSYIILTVVAVVITATVLAVGYFDSPVFNNIVLSDTDETVDVNYVSDIELQPVTGKIDLNNATLEELMTLEKIGEVRAQSIIDFRENNLGFCSVDELLLVNSISSSVYETIKDSVTVGKYTGAASDEF